MIGNLLDKGENKNILLHFIRVKAVLSIFRIVFFFFLRINTCTKLLQESMKKGNSGDTFNSGPNMGG